MKILEFKGKMSLKNKILISIGIVLLIRNNIGSPSLYV